MDNKTLRDSLRDFRWYPRKGTKLAGNQETVRRAHIDAAPSDEKPQRELENLIGWRKMKILPVGLLVSPFREGGMTSVLSEEAVCDRNPRHDAPEGDCEPGCGWYAFYDAKDIYIGRWDRRPGDVIDMDEAIVEVSAVGKTWLHDKGFRTKQIRMESIWVSKGTDAGLSTTLGEMYDIPIYEIPGRKEWDNARAADDVNQELKASVPKDDFFKKMLGDLDQWTSERKKSSSPPSPPSEPLGKSPLTSGRELIQKKELENLLHGRPSRYGSKQVREQAEYDLARARDELNRAMGKCAFCNKTDAHTHGLDDLKGES